MVAWPQEYKRVVIRVKRSGRVWKSLRRFLMSTAKLFLFSDGLIISKVWHSLIPNIFFVNKRATTIGFLYRTKS